MAVYSMYSQRAMGNPRQPLCSSKLPSKPHFRCLHSFIQHSAFKLDFIQLPLTMGYQYVPIICVFSRWCEAFLCCKANDLTVAKKLLENTFPMSSTIPSVQGIHFTEKIIQALKENLTNFLELALTLTPLIIRQG